MSVMNRARRRAKTGNTGGKNLKGAAKRASNNINQVVKRKARKQALSKKIAGAKKGSDRMKKLKARRSRVSTRLGNSRARATAATRTVRRNKKGKS